MVCGSQPSHTGRFASGGGFLMRSGFIFCSMTILLSLLSGCGGDESGKLASVDDTTPPTTPQNPMLESVTDSSITFTWTAPGDDGLDGIASLYDIRFSTDSLSNPAWTSAEAAPSPPDPANPGSIQSHSIGGLAGSTKYHFVIRAADEVPNWSCFSDVVTGRTAPDIRPPSAVTDLSVSFLSDSSVTLAWSAPGDDGVYGRASEYQIRYSTDSLTGIGWVFADVLETPPDPLRSGEEERCAVRGLEPGTNYRFGMIARDEAGNASSLSNLPAASTLLDTFRTLPVLPVSADQYSRGTNIEGSDTWPVHSVWVSFFLIDPYESTNAHMVFLLNWARANGLAFSDGIEVVGPAEADTLYFRLDEPGCRISFFDSVFSVQAGFEDHPVTGITWYGAAAACNWRSLREDRTTCYSTHQWWCDFEANGYRLPTEAEWEKAAHGRGTYPWGSGGPNRTRAVYWDGWLEDHPQPVGSAYAGSSIYGVYDLAGNVWEWCNDLYGYDYYSTGDGIGEDPRGPEDGNTRVIRGGSWASDRSELRCGNRHKENPYGSSDQIGFRCVRLY